jgi:hypothetical protein
VTVSGHEARRNLEIGAAFIREERDNPPIWEDKVTPPGTIHAKALEIELDLTPGKSGSGHRLYMDMKEDDRFNNPARNAHACYELTPLGEEWTEKLLREHANGLKPWLLSWQDRPAKLPRGKSS